MATTNNNKPIDNKQLWQQVEYAPVVNSAVSALTTQEDGNDRYIYYLSTSAFWRYDTYGNTWNKLAVPLQAPSALASMRYSKYSGTVGRVISSPSSTTLRIGGFSAGSYTGKQITIISGKGAGQTRTITNCPVSTIYGQGLTSAATTSILTDTYARWNINEFVGYTARIVHAAAAAFTPGQVREILYNDSVSLTVADINYQGIDSFSNAPFSSQAPYAAAPGTNTTFVIEATDLTVNQAWTVQPDNTSIFRIASGGIWLLSSLAAAPFASLQYYDVAQDYWINKTWPTGLIAAALGTDASLERTGEIAGITHSGTATSGTSYTLVNSAENFTPMALMNSQVRITGGTGAGQVRRIMFNDVTSVEVCKKWDVTPDATSTYEILPDRDAIYIAGNGAATLYQYHVDADQVIQSSQYDYGQVTTVAARATSSTANHKWFNIVGTRTTSGISAAAVNAAGTGYAVGDILALGTGTNGKVRVTSVSAAGAVTGIEVLRAGTGYSVASCATTYQTGQTGAGTGCTISVTAISSASPNYVVSYAVTPSHNLKKGDSITIIGDANYNGTYTITGVDTGIIEILTSSASAPVSATAQTTTVLTDPTRNWTVGEHIGKILQSQAIGTGGYNGTVYAGYITANTATTITVAAALGAAPADGTGRYSIIDVAAFGKDDQFRNELKNGAGMATNGSTTTVVDSTKTWTPNQWANYKMRIKAGTGRDQIVTITSNDATTLTFGTVTTAPVAGSVYYILDAHGIATGTQSTTTLQDTNKNWKINQWANKKVRFMCGTGFTAEYIITSNTKDTLTFATGTAPVAGATAYTILAPQNRGSGIELLWAFGTTAEPGRWIYCARGGASQWLDRYDIWTEEWDYAFQMSPMTDTLTTGSYYAYDGGNRIYFSPGVATSAAQYVAYLDLTNMKVYGFGSVPNIQGAAVLGNRMEIVTSPAGIDYLYHMRNTGQEIYRAQVFF